MAIKGARSIAEYAIRRWLAEQNFYMEFFTLVMTGNEGVLIDANNNRLTLVYDASEKSVYVMD